MFANGVLHERVPYLLLLFLVCCIILEDDAPALQPSVVTPGVAVGHDLAFEAFDIQLPPFVGFEVEVFFKTRVGARDTPRRGQATIQRETSGSLFEDLRKPGERAVTTLGGCTSGPCIMCATTNWRAASTLSPTCA